MVVRTIVSAIIIGAIIGALGRLVLPGRQAIGVILTVLIGIVAAVIGSYIAYRLGARFYIRLIIDVVLAAIGVALVSAAMHGSARRGRV